jgi:hypothetical protein
MQCAANRDGNGGTAAARNVPGLNAFSHSPRWSLYAKTRASDACQRSKGGSQTRQSMPWFVTGNYPQMPAKLHTYYSAYYRSKESGKDGGGLQDQFGMLHAGDQGCVCALHRCESGKSIDRRFIESTVRGMLSCNSAFEMITR